MPAKVRRVFTPEQRAYRLAYSREYHARPDIKERRAKKFAENYATPEGKARKRMASAQCYERTRDKILARQTIYNATPKGKSVKKKSRDKIVATPEGKAKAREYTLTYKKKPGVKEKIRARTAAWYAREDVQERIRSKEQSPEGRVANCAKAAKRRARIASLIGDVALIEKWMLQWRALKSVRCYWCRDSFPPSECHADHIVALADNGSHSVENLCVSCETCNRRKAAKPVSVWNQQISEPILL